MHLAIDLIHDTRHLCMRSRNDGIKAKSWGFSGGRQEKKSCQWKKSRLSLFIQGNRKLPPFILKDDNVKIWVEVIIVSFLYAVATLASSWQTVMTWILQNMTGIFLGRVAGARKRSHHWCLTLTPNNDMSLFSATNQERPYEQLLHNWHFEWLWRQTRPRLLVLAEFITCFPPDILRDIDFIPSIQERVQRWRVSWITSIVSGIVACGAPLSYWPIFSQSQNSLQKLTRPSFFFASKV